MTSASASASAGILAHLLGVLPYRELAAKAGGLGFRHVQLALWKAISDIDFSQPGKLSPGLAMEIGEQFDRHGVRVSMLGSYVHLFERDPEKRRLNVERFKEVLRHARWIGAPIVAAETGKPEDGMESERDWAVLKEVVSELAEEAAKWGVYVGLEPAAGHLIATADDMARFADELPAGSPLGVVLDPGNLLDAGNFGEQDRVIEHAFRLLGDRIVALHAKDRKLTADGKLAVVAPGEGEMNYPLIYRLLHEYKPHVHVIMEHVDERTMLGAKAYVERLRLEAAMR